MPIPRKKVTEKYMWSSRDFEEWVKGQQNKLKSNGFNISTAGVTHKLLNEVLVPNKIEINYPQMKYQKKKRR